MIFNVKPLWHIDYTKTKLYHDIIFWVIRINVTWQFLINYCTVHVFKKSIDEFCFNRCFHESSLRYYKKSSALCFTPDLYVFMSFGIVQVYLHSAVCRVCKGHLQNEWVIKPFWKHPKSLRIRDSKMEMVPIKLLGQATWNHRLTFQVLKDSFSPFVFFFRWTKESCKSNW